MPSIEGLDPALQTIGTIIFVAVVAIFSGWSLVFGRRKTEATETKEFTMAGQLADMGPVRELIEGVGLLVQQQVKTNIHLGELAAALKEDIEDRKKERDDRELEDEIDRRARIAAEDIVRRREEEHADRRPARKPA